MKRKVALLFVVTLFSQAIAFNVMAEDSSYQVYLGYSMLPLETTGLKDIALSDWYKYPNSEGRIELPLETEGKISGLVPGFILGVNTTGQLSAMIDLGVYAAKAKSYLVTGNLGVEYKFVEMKNMYVGFCPKLGVSLYQIDFGKTKILPGFVPPVILDEGTVYNDAEISAQLFGLNAQALLTAGINFGDTFEIFVNAGYVISFFGDMELKIKNSDTYGGKEVTIKKDSQALITKNSPNFGTRTLANIDPSGKSTGFIFTVGIKF